MPVRKPSTERQRRLGAELRRMREHIGMTINEAATVHRTDRTTVSNTESARSGVSSDRVRVWAANYRCPDVAYIDALADMARERGPRWWDEYRDALPAGLLDIAEMEHHALALRSAQIMHMPGLLQLPDYMRGIFAEAVPTMSPADLEQHVAFRLRRAEILDRSDPPPCEFLVRTRWNGEIHQYLGWDYRSLVVDGEQPDGKKSLRLRDGAKTPPCDWSRDGCASTAQSSGTQCVSVGPSRTGTPVGQRWTRGRLQP